MICPDDDEALKACCAAIFKAGAEAEAPSRPVINGHELGSMAACIFFDGYASTHPSFQNPYRRRS